MSVEQAFARLSEPRRFMKTTAVSGDTEVLAAIPGKQILVFAYEMQAVGTVVAKLTDGPGGVEHTIPWSFEAREGVVASRDVGSLWTGGQSKALTLNLSLAISVSVAVSYTYKPN